MAAKVVGWFAKAGHRWLATGALLLLFWLVYIIGTLVSWQQEYVSETVNPSFITDALGASVAVTLLVGLKYIALTAVSVVGKKRRAAAVTYILLAVAGLVFDVWLTLLTLSASGDAGLVFLAFNIDLIAGMCLTYLVLYLIVAAIMPKEK